VALCFHLSLYRIFSNKSLILLLCLVFFVSLVFADYFVDSFQFNMRGEKRTPIFKNFLISSKQPFFLFFEFHMPKLVFTRSFFERNGACISKFCFAGFLFSLKHFLGKRTGVFVSFHSSVCADPFSSTKRKTGV